VTPGRTDGGRSQGVNLSPNNSRDAERCGGPGGVQWTERPGNIDGPGDQGGDVVMSGRGVAWVPEYSELIF